MSVADEQLFWQRWQRANWYWANVVFEWLFLSGLALFALWPVIHRSSTVRFAVYVGLLPLVFLTPAYLGYAVFSFTSAGPSGGILYPYLLGFTRGGSLNDFDSWLLVRLPQVLEPLSTPIGSPMALTGMGMPGPTSVIIVGAVMGGISFAVISSLNWWMRARRVSHGIN